MKRRLLYLLKIYVAILAVFMIAKPLFMLYNAAGHHFSLTDVFSVLFHGFTLDASTALYFWLLPFLASVVVLWWNGWGIMRKALKFYDGVIAAMFSLAFVSDTSLYAFWDIKLDYTVLMYLDSTGDAFVSVSLWYMLVRLFLILLIGYLIYKLFVWITPMQLDEVALKRKITYTILSLLMIGPIVIGLRGGTSTAVTNVGQVYYSSDQFLNHSAVNPVFSFLSSLEKMDDENVEFHFFDDRRCASLTKGLYNTESIDSDTLLNTRRPNVVIIEMEGCGGSFTEIGGHPEIMPHLNQLAKEGVYFSNCYGNSYRTDRGTVCTFSGYPSFPNVSVMKIPAKSNTMPSIARELVKNGYATDFLYGGDINFTNMRAYVLATQYQKIKSDENFTKAEQGDGKWGVRDDITFNALYQQIISRKEKHWHTAFLTLSSHEPWTVPYHKFDYEVYNSFAYLDHCIGTFIGRLKKTPQWRNTLIIFLPDHGIRYPNLKETDLLRNHIPMIWVGGAVKGPRVISKICNQTDLAATLLGQMGIRHDMFRFSRDVVSKSYTYPFAYHTFDNGYMVVDSTGYTVYDLTSNRVIADRPKAGRHREEMGKAILQITSKDLKNRR